MNAFIKDIAYHLPDKVITNEDLVKSFPEWTAEKVANKIGVKKRYICGDDEYASDLAIQAAEKLFIQSEIDKSSIDFLLYCTQSPDYILPTTACTIQTRLDLPKSMGGCVQPISAI